MGVETKREPAFPQGGGRHSVHFPETRDASCLEALDLLSPPL
jgi:hypothetical protein